MRYFTVSKSGFTNNGIEDCVRVAFMPWYGPTTAGMDTDTDFILRQ
jgi:hypothetical protein